MWWLEKYHRQSNSMCNTHILPIIILAAMRMLIFSVLWMSIMQIRNEIAWMATLNILNQMQNDVDSLISPTRFWCGSILMWFGIKSSPKLYQVLMVMMKNWPLIDRIRIDDRKILVHDFHFIVINLKKKSWKKRQTWQMLKHVGSQYIAFYEANS